MLTQWWHWLVAFGLIYIGWFLIIFLMAGFIGTIRWALSLIWPEYYPPAKKRQAPQGN